MAAGTSSSASPDAGGNPLLRLSIRTKALVIANEYTHRQMEPNELAQVLEALAPTASERAQIARAVEEELRASRYPMSEIVRLMGEIVPKEPEQGAAPGPEPESAPSPDAPESAGGPMQGQGAPPLEPHPTVASANEKLLVTQKVRAPHLLPFEHYEFQTPEADVPRPSETLAAAPAPGQAPPTQKVPVGDALKAAAELESRAQREGGAEPSPARRAPQFSIDRLKGLAKTTPEAGKTRPVVLVADDDMRARVMYRMKLEQSGYVVREAKDGIDAWNQVKSGEIEYLVTDMKMPGYHGLEILGRMIDSAMDIPVVVVSAFDQLQHEFVVSAYPRLKFLPKPASPESVAAAIGGFVREAREENG